MGFVGRLGTLPENEFIHLCSQKDLIRIRGRRTLRQASEVLEEYFAPEDAGTAISPFFLELVTDILDAGHCSDALLHTRIRSARRSEL